MDFTTVTAVVVKILSVIVNNIPPIYEQNFTPPEGNRFLFPLPPLVNGRMLYGGKIHESDNY